MIFKRLPQPIFDGIDGQLGAVVQVELGQQAADVRLDRLLADDQLVGDLAVAQSLRHLQQHLALALGDVAGRGTDGRGADT